MRNHKTIMYPLTKNSAIDCVLQESAAVDYDRLKMIDLFAGAGGLSEGLSMVGFDSLFASEIVPAYARTYERNHPRAIVRTSDIRQLDPSMILREIGIRRGDLDLMDLMSGTILPFTRFKRRSPQSLCPKQTFIRRPL